MNITDAEKIAPNRLIFFITLLCITVASCQIHTASSIPEPANPYQLLVTFKQSAAEIWPSFGSVRSYRPGHEWEVPMALRAKISRLAKRFELFEQKVWPIDSLKLHCVVFAVERDRNLPQLLTEIEHHPGVVSAQPMNEFIVMGSRSAAHLPEIYNDPHFTLQYGKHTEEIRLLHEYTRGDKIRIAVIDTTADLEHPDLEGQIARQYDYVNTDINKNASGRVDNIRTDQTLPPGTHGTAVAGIIAAKANNNAGVVGLAPEARLYVYGACKSDNKNPARCNSFNLARALEQAIADRIQVINLSLAGPHDPLLEQLLSVAHKRGMITIAAANTLSTENNFPASMEGVVGVTASAAVEAVRERFGDWVGRPEKFSTQAGGGYQFFYGSSVSAASLSGVAALIRSFSSREETLQILRVLVDGDCQPQYNSSTHHVVHLLTHSHLCEKSARVIYNGNSYVEN